MKDENFVCENCGFNVLALGYTARDHCPQCLYSKHVDIMPGDRQSDCKGMYIPVGVEKFKNTFKIIYKCEKCHKMHKNIVAKDDNMDVIIFLTTNNNF
ncbi:MAG TPA: RNHCP domain-containing protein [Mollicutes bacterium]|nr:RNHCP domain-containing protein [Mollicutes bacterium]